ncbi:MAG: capsular polysaccharide biosynthesis protein [Sandaracinaceae bacterium]
MHLLGQVDHRYVMTSSMGLEALVAGCSVTCFGMPFYAGWGLTDDRAPVPDRRGRARTLEELVALAYVRYPRYVDPETGEGGDVDTVIEHLALQRACGADHARTRHVCVGFSRWKRAFLPSFLDGPGAQIEFVSRREVDRELNGGDALVVWASREHESLKRLAETRNASLLRMEDGFLRSVGLGSDLFAPASLVVDTRGMYYDPSAPSDLEHILAETAWSDAELTRAAALRRLIIERRISKYNVGARGRIGARANGRAVALAIGQVEDDASIQRGCLDVRTNEALVRAARMASPHAYLIYKPHPDVVSGNRRDGFPLELAERLADEVVVDATLPDCLDVADEVHTMTSLVGFEALLRELRVFVYGQPFYAGWGLTHDRHPHPRRTRRLTLDELVAGTLLRYPRYVHPNSGAYTTPERVVTFLASAPRPPAWTTTWAGRQVRKGQNLLSEVLRAP